MNARVLALLSAVQVRSTRQYVLVDQASFSEGLDARLHAVRVRAEVTLGSNELEDLLEELLAFIVTGAEHRAVTEAALGQLIHAETPGAPGVLNAPGAVETIEFCMLALRWESL